ncbi:LEM3 (ligand-effect modulator 3) family / CDC50 family [Lotmaria passim]
MPRGNFASLATPRTSGGAEEVAHSSSSPAPQQRQYMNAGASASLSADPDAHSAFFSRAARPGLSSQPTSTPAAAAAAAAGRTPSPSSSSVSSSTDSDTDTDSISFTTSTTSTVTSSSSSSERSDEDAKANSQAGATADEASKSTTLRARHWIKKKLIPQSVQDYGKTVYGGQPLTQQTLPGFFNYPPPFLLVPFFFLFMIPFIVVGANLLVQGPRHRIYEQEYSHIHQYQYLPNDPAVNVNQGLFKFTAEGVTHAQGTRTWLAVNITHHLKAPVYMYYKLSNFYQNHRDFHDGRSNPQLTGKQNLGNTYACKPYTHPGFREDEMDTPISFTDANGVKVNKTLEYFTYSPCGLAPWSMFNDTFVLYRQLTAAEAAEATASGATVLRGGADGTAPLKLICNGTDFGLRGQPLDGSVAPNHCAKKGISWKADRNIRFHNMTLREDWWSRYYPYETDNEFLRHGWYLHEPGHSLPDQMDFDLQVWVRASFTSSFHKLYRIISVDLERGTYWVDITELYDVVSFRGRKSIVLHGGHWTGGRNTVLGIIFVVMGCLSFVFGVAFLVECLLQRNGVNRYEHLPEPKRSWYVFPPDDLQFAHYYQLRLRRHIPMAQLQTLRKTVEELEGLAAGSQFDPLAHPPPLNSSNSSDGEEAEREVHAAHATSAPRE